MGAFIFLIVLFAVLLVIGLAMIWSLPQSSGSLVVVTGLTPDEVADGVESAFVPGGWDVRYRGADFMTLQSGPSGCSALILLIIFLPLGLIYLLTDWGRGKLTVRYEERKAGETEVQLSWSNASIKAHVQSFAQWLTEDA